MELPVSMEQRAENAAKDARRLQILLRMRLLKAGVIGPRPQTLSEELMGSVSRPALVIGSAS
jgi:hypothetical protein